MKKLLHTLLLFAVGLFAACQAPTSGGDVYLNDFLDDLTAQTDAGPAIRAALSHPGRTAYSSGWRTPDTTRSGGRKVPVHQQQRRRFETDCL